MDTEKSSTSSIVGSTENSTTSPPAEPPEIVEITLSESPQSSQHTPHLSQAESQEAEFLEEQRKEKENNPQLAIELKLQKLKDLHAENQINYTKELARQEFKWPDNQTRNIVELYRSSRETVLTAIIVLLPSIYFKKVDLFHEFIETIVKENLLSKKLSRRLCLQLSHLDDTRRQAIGDTHNQTDYSSLLVVERMRILAVYWMKIETNEQSLKQAVHWFIRSCTDTVTLAPYYQTKTTSVLQELYNILKTVFSAEFPTHSMLTDSDKAQHWFFIFRHLLKSSFSLQLVEHYFVLLKPMIFPFCESAVDEILQLVSSRWINIAMSIAKTPSAITKAGGTINSFLSLIGILADIPTFQEKLSQHPEIVQSFLLLKRFCSSAEIGIHQDFADSVNTLGMLLKI